MSDAPLAARIDPGPRTSVGPAAPAVGRVLVVVAVPAEAAAVLAGSRARPVRLGPYEAAVPDEPTTDERTTDERTTRGLAADERTADERTGGERTAHERTTDERTTDERTTDQRTTRGLAADERTADERTGGERTAHERTLSGLSGLSGLVVLAGGVGPARAAAAAGTALALAPFDLVLSAGVGGGFAGRAGPGDLVLADRVVHADLGAGSPDGFLPVDRLGFGELTTVLDAGLVARAAAATGALVGPVLTVSTVTGTVQRAAELAAAHRPIAEAMEGAGVLAAAQAHGVPFLELRAISNPVGRRDRAGWDLPGALARLGPAVRALAGAAVRTGAGR